MSTLTYNINCSMSPLIAGWTNIGAGPNFELGEVFGPGQGWGWDTPGVGALWRSTTINSTIAIASGGTIYDVTGAEDPGAPFPSTITQAALQALIDGGATIVEGTQAANIGGLNLSISWQINSGTDYPATYPFLPGATLSDMMAAAWVAKNTTGGAGQVEFAYVSFDLDVPDAPTLEVIGSGGIEVGDIAVDYIEMSPQIIIVSSGGLKINSGADLVLSQDISGIYTLIKDKTNDTLYNRTAGGSITSLVVKIPDPFIKSGFIGS